MLSGSFQVPAQEEGIQMESERIPELRRQDRKCRDISTARVYRKENYREERYQRKNSRDRQRILLSILLISTTMKGENLTFGQGTCAFGWERTTEWIRSNCARNNAHSIPVREETLEVYGAVSREYKCYLHQQRRIIISRPDTILLLTKSKTQKDQVVSM